MPPQPILFIHHANDMYGADIGLLHSLNSLDKSKYYPIVILPSDMPKGMLSLELSRLGFEYHFAHLGILRRKYLTIRSIVPLTIDILRGVAYVRSLARRRKAALVYINTIVAVSGAIGGRLSGAPVLWHIREIVSMPRSVRWVLYKALSVCADSVVCISHAVRDSLLREEPTLTKTSLVIYNAVSEPSRNGFVEQVGLREELKVPQSAPLVGMVGRISHWKGQEVLVEAASLMQEKHPDLHFVAVGSYFADQTHYLQQLETKIKDLKLDMRFHLAPYRSNVTDVYRALDIFVLPSRNPEPFGRVTVEAMTQGRAVIATNHGGTCELIQDGITGILVPPSDPESLADAIDLLLRDPELRERVGRAAAADAKRRFCLPRYEQQMSRTIDGLIDHITP
jgi:glycosyltransferase involved in cell wall biosynthesis